MLVARVRGGLVTLFKLEVTPLKILTLTTWYSMTIMGGGKQSEVLTHHPEDNGINTETNRDFGPQMFASPTSASEITSLGMVPLNTDNVQAYSTPPPVQYTELVNDG